MANRVVGLTIAVVLGCALFASQASAAPVQCGDVITEDLKLQADLTDCPDDGLVVGADRITINLNGHEISSACIPLVDCAGKVGIDNSGGFDRVRIRDGAVDGFERTILLVGADRNTLARLDVDDGIGAFHFDESRLLVLEGSDRNVVKDSDFDGSHTAVLLTGGSDRNRIARSRMDGIINMSSGVGLEISEGSDANTVVDSEVGGQGPALIIADSARTQIKRSEAGSRVDGIGLWRAERTVLVGNTLDGGMGIGIRARGANDLSTIRDNHILNGIILEGDRNVVVRNDLISSGFNVPPFSLVGGDRNVIRYNGAVGGLPWAIGIQAEATRTSLIGNSASDATDAGSGDGVGDGIRIEAAGTLVRGNTANDNGALGINAVEGVIDGGDNHASGNGDPRQCVGVICTP